MQVYAFPSKARHVFAFAHRKPSLAALPPPVFSQLREWERQGLVAHGTGDAFSPWRVSALNTGHSLCESYPELLLVPACTTDDALARVARFRTRRRVPTLAWSHPKSGATLWRSSQPRVGISMGGSGHRCKEDEQLLAAVWRATRGRTKVLVADCRPRANAMVGAGAGVRHSPPCSPP